MQKSNSYRTHAELRASAKGDSRDDGIREEQEQGGNAQDSCLTGNDRKPAVSVGYGIVDSFIIEVSADE
ncbi:hypothetical protein D3C79_940900 [compost metagenome]